MRQGRMPRTGKGKDTERVGRIDGSLVDRRGECPEGATIQPTREVLGNARAIPWDARGRTRRAARL